MSSSGGSTRATHFERAGYWFGATAFVAVIGALCIQISLAEFSKVGDRNDLWSYGWFRLGIVIEVFASLCFLRALQLGWRNWRKERAAESQHGASLPRIDIPVASKEQPETEVPRDGLFDLSIPRINIKPYKFARKFSKNTTIRAEQIIAPYAQQALRFKGAIKDVETRTRYGNPDYLEVEFKPGFIGSYNVIRVIGEFSEDYRQRLLVLPKGRKVTVLGYLRSASEYEVRFSPCAIE
jgi:hypothetical protein